MSITRKTSGWLTGFFLKPHNRPNSIFFYSMVRCEDRSLSSHLKPDHYNQNVSKLFALLCYPFNFLITLPAILISTRLWALFKRLSRTIIITRRKLKKKKRDQGYAKQRSGGTVFLTFCFPVKKKKIMSIKNRGVLASGFYQFYIFQ